MTKSQYLILASGSSGRLELLKNVDIIPDKIIVTDVDETPYKKEKPRIYCKRVAEAKLNAAVKKLSKKNAFIIAADTTAVSGGKFLHKSDNDNGVRKCLEAISGRRHKVYSAVFCGYVEDGKLVDVKNRVVITTVMFKRFTKDEIDFLICSKQGIGKCGGIQISGLASRYVKFISGSFCPVPWCVLPHTWG